MLFLEKEEKVDLDMKDYLFLVLIPILFSVSAIVFFIRHSKKVSLDPSPEGRMRRVVNMRRVIKDKNHKDFDINLLMCPSNETKESVFNQFVRCSIIQKTEKWRGLSNE